MTMGKRGGRAGNKSRPHTQLQCHSLRQFPHVVAPGFGAVLNLGPPVGRGGLGQLPGQLDALGFEGRGVGLAGVGRAGYRGVGAVVQGLDFGIKRIAGPPKQGFGKPPACVPSRGRKWAWRRRKAAETSRYCIVLGLKRIPVMRHRQSVPWHRHKRNKTIILSKPEPLGELVALLSASSPRLAHASLFTICRFAGRSRGSGLVPVGFHCCSAHGR